MRNYFLFLTISGFMVFQGCAIRPDARYYNEPMEEETVESSDGELESPSNQPAVKNHTNNIPNRLSISENQFAKFQQEIQRFWGAPYKWGGASPSGTDCSGLISTVYKKAFNMKLPHSSKLLFNKGKAVSATDLFFGDLVFFAFSKTQLPSHVGIYIKSGMFLHASESEGVTLGKLKKSPWHEAYWGARRIIQ